MFDFDIGKLMVVAIVALAVIPPKDLPRVMRTVGQVVGRMRRMAAEFQGQFMDAMREADLENVRKELETLNEKAKADMSASFDPVAMVRDDVTKAAEAQGIGTSQVSLTGRAPDPVAISAPLPPEIGLEDVRKELEALNEQAKPMLEPVPTSPDDYPAPRPLERETPERHEERHEPPAAKSSAAE